MFDIKEWYKMVAANSSDLFDYWEKASYGLAILCIGMGKVPDGAGYKNFIESWEARDGNLS